MRYEHIELDLSTHALDIIRAQLLPRLGDPSVPMPVAAELVNFSNAIRARLQHHDPDPQSPRNDKQEADPNADLVGLMRRGYDIHLQCSECKRQTWMDTDRILTCYRYLSTKQYESGAIVTRHCIGKLLPTVTERFSTVGVLQ